MWNFMCCISHRFFKLDTRILFRSFLVDVLRYSSLAVLSLMGSTLTSFPFFSSSSFLSSDNPGRNNDYLVIICASHCRGGLRASTLQ
ncbi:hypothetical protein BDW68DRAFT_171925 [Aspergillus falconensis]